MSQTEAEILKGTVESITYRNDENGYCVFELSANGELVTAVGIMPFIHAGEQVVLQGAYTVHPTYGPQFKVEQCERSLPATSAAVLRYLASGAVRGIGPVTAQHIVERFGDDALKIIETQPERLSEIKGISMSKAMKISEDFMRQFGVREVMLKLSELQITASEALRIYKKLGATSVEKISENPYRLCSEGIGFGFERADEIAKHLQNSVPLQYRIKAGIEYVLRHNLRNGHTCLPADKLCQTAAMLLQVEPEETMRVLHDMQANGDVTAATLHDAQFIFLPFMYKAERNCANRIALMLQVPPAEIPIHKNRLSQFENDNGILYDGRQREAIGSALSKGILVLTGGPGTGKTTTLNAIISLLEEAGCNIALAAPTGRAAKRMSELTGREAQTLHRLLEVEWGDDDRQQFKRNEDNPLENDVIVVDELSMIDVQLFDALLRAMTVHCRLILVGDVDQLPSVGAGNVLNDLIASDVVPVVRLERIFRQSDDSLIVTNAHRVIQGEMPEINNKSRDFFVIEKRSAAAAAELVGELYCQRLSKAYGFSPLSNIQVLCPSRKRTSGSVNLNNLLQAQINPPDKHRREVRRNGFIMREGDKVMQIRNNYDIYWQKDDGTDGTGVFNGDIGLLLQVDNVNSCVKVKFDDKVATYTGEEIDDLELSYAVTVHKSQGNEFDCVILPVTDVPPPLCYRNLLYTAITRAKKMLVLIGTQNDIRRMVENNKKSRRYTAFSDFLSAAVQPGVSF